MSKRTCRKHANCKQHSLLEDIHWKVQSHAEYLRKQSKTKTGKMIQEPEARPKNKESKEYEQARLENSENSCRRHGGSCVGMCSPQNPKPKTLCPMAYVSSMLYVSSILHVSSWAEPVRCAYICHIYICVYI